MRHWGLAAGLATVLALLSPVLAPPKPASAQITKQTTIDPEDLARRKAEQDARRAAEEKAKQKARDEAWLATIEHADVRCRLNQVRVQDGIVALWCGRPATILESNSVPLPGDAAFYVSMEREPALAQLAAALGSDAYHANAVIRLKGERGRRDEWVLGYGGLYRLKFIQLYRDGS